MPLFLFLLLPVQAFAQCDGSFWQQEIDPESFRALLSASVGVLSVAYGIRLVLRVFSNRR